MMWNSEVFVSLAAALGGGIVSAYMYYLEKHPRSDLKPRLFPTTLFLLLGGLLAIGAIVHLIGLAGFKIPQQNQP